MKLADVEQPLSAGSEELAAVDSHLRALQGVLREDMGYGRSGNEEATALKTCQGVHEAVAEWLIVPAGLDRAVEACSVSASEAGSSMVRSPHRSAIAFLMEKGARPRHLHSQAPRWTVRARSNEWWTGMAAVRGHRASGRFGRASKSIAQRRAGLSVRSAWCSSRRCEDAMALVGAAAQGQAPDGPTFVTRAGEILDAAGIVTGGQVELNRRTVATPSGSDAIGREANDVGGKVEQARQRREALQAESQSLAGGGAASWRNALREEEMKALSLQKDASGIQQLLGDLTQRIETLMGDAQRGSLEVQRLEAGSALRLRHSWRSGSPKKPGRKGRCRRCAAGWRSWIRACTVCSND